MLAVAFAENWMKENQALAPLVIFLGLACNNGSHCGTSPLAQYLDSVALQINHAVVTPTGNDGIRQHHYRGNISNQKEQIVEINIERDIAGFYLECWSLAPERVLIQVRSPNGETRPTSANMDNLSQSYRFPLEGTKITIDYRDVGKRRRDQLVFVRFENKPSKEDMIEMWKNFKGRAQELELPSAPKQFLHYFEEDNMPQTKLHRNLENGMAVSIGRLREDSQYDYKFVCLAHNTLRGAAGGAVLLAELLCAEGYMD